MRYGDSYSIFDLLGLSTFYNTFCFIYPFCHSGDITRLFGTCYQVNVSSESHFHIVASKNRILKAILLHSVNQKLFIPISYFVQLKDIRENKDMFIDVFKNNKYNYSIFEDLKVTVMLKGVEGGLTN